MKDSNFHPNNGHSHPIFKKEEKEKEEEEQIHVNRCGLGFCLFCLSIYK